MSLYFGQHHSHEQRIRAGGGNSISHSRERKDLLCSLLDYIHGSRGLFLWWKKARVRPDINFNSRTRELRCELLTVVSYLFFTKRTTIRTVAGLSTRSVNTFAIFLNRLSFQLCFLYTFTEIRFRRTRSIAIGLARRTITCNEGKH